MCVCRFKNVEEVPFIAVFHIGETIDSRIVLGDIITVCVTSGSTVYNRNCLGTGNEVFRKMFGNNDYSFIAGRIKFLMINTNAIEYDYSEPVPDFDFLETEVKKDSALFDRTIVCMHAAPYSEQFNNNVAKPFNHYMQFYPGLMFCLYGHGHHTEEHDIFENGTIYYEVASVEKREYRIFTITPKGYSNEVISF